MPEAKKLMNPHMFRSPDKKGIRALSKHLFDAGWHLWQNSDDGKEYGENILWELSKMGVLCDHKTAEPFKSQEKMLEAFEKWIEAFKKHEKKSKEKVN